MFLDASASLDQFLEQTATRVVPITEKIGRAALSAFDRYGRGRHSAALNMGDRFAYAATRSLGIPLLFKGNFPQTDIEAA